MPTEPRDGGGVKVSRFPDRKTLEAALTAMGGGGPVAVLLRRRNEYASTFPTEVVTCRLADGTERRLFCKYAAGRSQRDHGHRGDVAYEARVYRHLLQGVPLP